MFANLPRYLLCITGSIHLLKECTVLPKRPVNVHNKAEDLSTAEIAETVALVQG